MLISVTTGTCRCGWLGGQRILLIELRDNGSGLAYQAGRKVELSAADIRCVEYVAPEPVEVDIVEKPVTRQRKPESWTGWEATMGHVLARAPGLVRCAAREVNVPDSVADQLATELSSDWHPPIRTRSRNLPTAAVEARARAKAERMAAKAAIKAERLALTQQRQAERQAALAAVLERKAERKLRQAERAEAKAEREQRLAARAAAAAASAAARAAEKDSQQGQAQPRLQQAAKQRALIEVAEREAAINGAIDRELQRAWAKLDEQHASQPVEPQRERELVAA